MAAFPFVLGRVPKVREVEIGQEQVDGAVLEVLSSSVANRSPLVETIVATSREPEFRRAKQREIVLISDLMQNSAAANFYQRIPSDVERFSTRSDLGKADLRDTELNVRYAARRSQWRKRDKVRAFWRDWVEWQDGAFKVETE